MGDRATGVVNHDIRFVILITEVSQHVATDPPLGYYRFEHIFNSAIKKSTEAAGNPK